MEFETTRSVIYTRSLGRVMPVAIAVFLIFAGVRWTNAQYPMSEGRASASSERELEEHVARMRYLISQANKRRPNRHRDPALALEELQEDFTRLQVVNKDLVLTTAKTDTVDLKFVAKSAEEINKRAKRLLENLALPEPASQAPSSNEASISDQPQLKQSITQMGWLIYYFTKNPIFKEAGVLDTSSAAKARTDLEQIVALSTLIRASSERLRKNNSN